MTRHIMTFECLLLTWKFIAVENWSLWSLERKLRAQKCIARKASKAELLVAAAIPRFFLFHCLGLAKESKLMSDLGGLSVTAVCLLHDPYEPGLEDGSEVPCMLDLVFHDLLGWYLHSYTVWEAYTPLYYRIFMNRSWSQQNWAYVWKNELDVHRPASGSEIFVGKTFRHGLLTPFLVTTQ